MDERRYEHIAWRYRQGNGPWNYTEDKDAIQADLADEVEKVYADPIPDAPEKEALPKCPWCGEPVPVGRHVGDCHERSDAPERLTEEERRPWENSRTPFWFRISSLADWIECEYPNRGPNKCLGSDDVAYLREAARRLRGAEREALTEEEREWISNAHEMHQRGSDHLEMNSCCKIVDQLASRSRTPPSGEDDA